MAHNLALKGLSLGVKSKQKSDFSNLKQTLWGREYPNPVGLAGGFDKDGEAVKGLERCGFGFLEVGTVTPRPQAGNPRPRLFRLSEDQAIINRMGFNNKGADNLLKNTNKHQPSCPLHINIGCNKDSPDRVQDYVHCMSVLYPAADAFVVNVSSPNTEKLRALQQKGELSRLVDALQEKRQEYEKDFGWVPLLVKIAPDLSQDEERSIIELALSAGLDGLVVGNTTVKRSGLKNKHKNEPGGLSGMPLTDRNTLQIQRFSNLLGGKMPIVGVGGIMTPDDALAKLKAGASLIQIYTGFVYNGPKLIREINQNICKYLINNNLFLEQLRRPA